MVIGLSSLAMTGLPQAGPGLDARSGLPGQKGVHRASAAGEHRRQVPALRVVQPAGIDEDPQPGIRIAAFGATGARSISITMNSHVPAIEIVFYWPGDWCAMACGVPPSPSVEAGHCHDHLGTVRLSRCPGRARR
jgi:hypothetical protein